MKKKRRARIVPEVIFATAVSAFVVPGLVTACGSDTTDSGDDHAGSAGKGGAAAPEVLRGRLGEAASQASASVDSAWQPPSGVAREALAKAAVERARPIAKRRKTPSLASAVRLGTSRARLSSRLLSSQRRPI